MLEIYCKVCPWRGGFGDLARVKETDDKGKVKWILICPVCGRAEVYKCKPTFESVSTTQEKTANAQQYRRWLKLHKRTNTYGEDRVWVFSDGSSTGSFACVILVPGEEPVRMVRHLAQPANRNVGCEIMGVAMGLKHCPDGVDVTVVSDFLGTACWLNCYWKLADAAAVPRLGVVAHLIQAKQLTVRFIHHKGHQKDASDFTRWNNECDRLCSVKARKEALDLDG